MFQPFKEMEYNKKIEVIETLILFAVIFLPSFLLQGTSTDGDVFNSIGYNLALYIQFLPHIGLMLFIINKKPNKNQFFLKKISLNDIYYGIIYSVGIWIIFIPIMLILGLVLGENSELINRIQWKINSIKILPIVFISCIVVGYHEEIFFRSYLYTQLKKYGIKENYSIGIVTIIFALGHIYQGTIAFFITGILGFYLLYIFRKTKSIHIAAIAHGVYNFTTLVLTMINQK